MSDSGSLYATLELVEDKTLTLKGQIEQKNGLFFAPSKESRRISDVATKLNEMYCNPSPQTKCVFCNVDYVSAQNVFRVGANLQRSPTTIEKQTQIQSDGFALICNLGGWHTLNELVVSGEHLESVFDLPLHLQKALLSIVEDRWRVFLEVRDGLVKQRGTVDDLWLTMTINDRMGAGIRHFHAHVSLSPYRPDRLMKKLEPRWNATIGQTKSHTLHALHGLGTEIIVQSKSQTLGEEWSTKRFNGLFDELEKVRRMLLEMTESFYEARIPLNEGLFMPYARSGPLVYSVYPYVHIGALERFRDDLFFGTSAEANARLFRSWLLANCPPGLIE